MKKIMLLFALILVALPLAAQTPVKFSISGKALGYSAGGFGTVAADAVSGVQISPNLTVRNDNIILSDPASASIAAFELGGAQYNLPLSKILSKSYLDPAKYKFYGVGELGLVTSSLGQKPSFSAGVGLNYFPASTPSLAVNLFEVRWLGATIPIGNGKTASNGLAVSVGLQFQ